MQKEIDALREAQKLLQQRLREMEMSNDDMERNDRLNRPQTIMLTCKGGKVLVGGYSDQV